MIKIQPKLKVMEKYTFLILIILMSLISNAQIRDSDNDDFLGGNLWQTGKIMNYRETTNGLVTRTEKNIKTKQLMTSIDWYERFIIHADFSVVQGLIFSGVETKDGGRLGFHSSIGFSYGRWFNYNNPIQIGPTDLVIGAALVGEVNWIAKKIPNKKEINFDHYTPGLALYLDYKIGKVFRVFNITEYGRIKANTQRRWSNQTKGWVRLIHNFGLTMAVEYQYYSETIGDKNSSTITKYESNSLLYQFGIGVEF